MDTKDTRAHAAAARASEVEECQVSAAQALADLERVLCYEDRGLQEIAAAFAASPQHAWDAADAAHCRAAQHARVVYCAERALGAANLDLVGWERARTVLAAAQARLHAAREEARRLFILAEEA